MTPTLEDLGAPESPAYTRPTHPVFSILSQKQILSIAECRQQQIAIWVGAISAGKTFASLIAFLDAVMTAPVGESIVMIGKTRDTVERNVINQLKNPRLFGALADAIVHTSGASRLTVLGRQVEIVGAYNAGAEERIRGGTFGLVYVDEVTLLPQEFWNMLTTRLRVPGARLLGTTNPGSRNHWLRKEWIIPGAAKSVVTFEFTLWDNPGLEQSYVDDLIARFQGNRFFYERFILGRWTSAEGAIYETWLHEKHTIPWASMPVLQDIIAVGIDHGTTNPTSAIMLGITDEHLRGRAAPRLILLDEWRHDPGGDEARRLTNVEQSRAIQTWMRQWHTPNQELMKPRLMFVDPAAADFREQLRRDRVINYAADNAVLEGIADVSNLITQHHLIVAEPSGGPNTPGCAGFLSEVTEYVWSVKASEKGEDAPLKEHDHSMDAARYAIRSTRKIWYPILRRAYGLAA